ncbi:hypothetical protein EMEDMD4_1280022 [Sinorhizobium medicae]|uniref:Uncharacterized protein n=1 Tax=Sinorhizobium medicae TaxID=110321 RepID=A0A508WQZ1_9HYPH|nr:hypothetical protein EMEDMD4_1280022 [Sinorhizobium medicae]
MCPRSLPSVRLPLPLRRQTVQIHIIVTQIPLTRYKRPRLTVQPGKTKECKLVRQA